MSQITPLSMPISEDELDPHCSLPHDECDVTRLLKKIIFGTTVGADVVTLIVLILFRKYQSFSQRIFLNILLCNFAEGIGHLIDDGLNENLCRGAGFLVQSFGFALFLWIAGLSLFLFLLIVKKMDTQAHERKYSIVCWGLPLILGCVPFFTDSYGPAGAYCWVINEGTGRYLRFIIWWGPVICGVVLIFIAFTIMYLRSTRKNISLLPETFQIQHKRLVRKYLRPLTGYAASFVILHTIMFIDRLVTINRAPVFILRVFQIISISSYGLILCTLFYLTNGRKEFSTKKLKEALWHHKYNLTCQHKLSKIVTFAGPNTGFAPNTTNIEEDAEVNAEVNDAFEPDNLQQNIPLADHHTVISEPGTYNEREPEQMLQNQQAGENYDCRPKTLHFNGPNHKIDLDKECDSELELTELNTELDESRSIGVPLKSRGCSDSMYINNNLSPHHKYEMTQNSNLIQVYLQEKYISLETWSDTETVEDFTARLTPHLLAGSVIHFQDQNGIYFSGRVTLIQIRSACSSLNITVNSKITQIKFPHR